MKKGMPITAANRLSFFRVTMLPRASAFTLMVFIFIVTTFAMLDTRR